MIRIIIIIMALLMANASFAQNMRGKIEAEDNRTGLFYAHEQLANASEEQAAFDLMLELRCIQCQSQSIADSDAPIAQAMRHQVRLQIEQGKKQDEIKDWMIARYGDYVSFDPSLSGVSIALWIAPMLIFLIALYLIIPLFRKQQNKQNDQEVK